MQYRVEEKYICDMVEYEILCSRLSAIMEKDNNSLDGSYNIKSLYFDDIDSSSFYENEFRVNNRSKYSN